MIDSAPFELGFKATLAGEDDGTLYVEGYASDFEDDRDDEAFLPGAFAEGLKAYLDLNPVLLYHHDPSKALGEVVEARLDQKGLHIKARIPKPAAGGWADTIYRQVQQGIIRGFSVGGNFKRRMTPAGPRIFKADLQEISVTPLPVNPRTMFALSQKAFSGEESEPINFDALERTLVALEATLDGVSAL